MNLHWCYGGVWYTGTEARTSWIDATIYPKPFATKYDVNSSGTFPAIVGQIRFRTNNII